MMQALRNSTKPIFLVTIFAFIVGFIFLDIGQGSMGCSPGLNPTTLLVVNGDPITREEFQVRFATAIQTQTQGSLSNRVRLQIEQQTLEQMIEDAILRQAAEKRGMGTNLEEVLQLLQNRPPADVQRSPIFQTDGRFDMAKYYQALSNNQFLGQMSSYYLQQLPIDKLNSELTAQARASRGELDEFRSWRTETAKISFVRVVPSLFGPDPAALDDADVRAHLEANRGTYAPAASAVVTYGYLRRRPSAEDRVEVQEVAESIVYELGDGQSFDELLEIHSEAPRSQWGGPSGAFIGPESPTMTVELSAALDTLEIGEYTRPFEDTYGFHVVLLDSVRTGDDGTRRFRIKDIRLVVDLTSTTESELELRMFRIWEAARAGADLHAVADTAAGFSVYTTPQIDLTKEKPFIDSNLPAFDELLSFARKADTGDISGIVEGPGGWYFWRLDRRGPGETPALDEIENQVRQDIVAARGRDEARRLAESIVSRARAGETLETIAERDTLLRLQSSQPFARAGFVSGIGRFPEIIGAAFALPVGSVEGPFETDEGIFVVIRVDERQAPPAPEDVARTNAAIERDVVNVKREQILGSYLRELRGSANVKDFREIKIGKI